MLCLTNKDECCDVESNRAGEWYFPNGDKVEIKRFSSISSFYRNRGEQAVLLNSRGNSMERGHFRCEIPDANDQNQSIFANIGMNKQHS